MSFARTISNRVFYMDEGGIYEEGSPEELFDSPKRDKTRQFIRQLRVFEAEVDSKEYDFISMGAELDLYLLQNDVPPAQKYRITLAIEELVQQILLPDLNSPQIHVVVEYSENSGSSVITVTYNGDRFDIRETDNKLSLSVLTNMAGDIDYKYTESENKPNRVEIRIKTHTADRGKPQ